MIKPKSGSFNYYKNLLKPSAGSQSGLEFGLQKPFFVGVFYVILLFCLIESLHAIRPL